MTGIVVKIKRVDTFGQKVTENHSHNREWWIISENSDRFRTKWNPVWCKSIGKVILGAALRAPLKPFNTSTAMFEDLQGKEGSIRSPVMPTISIR